MGDFSLQTIAAQERDQAAEFPDLRPNGEGAVTTRAATPRSGRVKTSTVSHRVKRPKGVTTRRDKG